MFNLCSQPAELVNREWPGWSGRRGLTVDWTVQGRRFRRALTIVAASSIALAAAAYAAEVHAAELEGTTNEVTVEQGSSTTFTMSLSATGMIRCIATASNPATAAVPGSYAIGAAGGVTTGALADPVPFYADPSCNVTWPGDPVPHKVPVTVSAHADTVPGTYTMFVRATTTTPVGSGERLEDRTASIITVTVVEGSDKVAPAVDCTGPHGTSGANDWYVSGVTFECTASDDGSGLADPSDGAFYLSTSGEGTVMTDDHTVADVAGNESVAGPYGPYDVDLVDPQVEVSSPGAGAVYVVGSSANASYACWDPGTGSGLSTCEGTIGNGDALATGVVGSHTFVVTATDHAGRTKTVEHTYDVVYDFGGFDLPGKRKVTAGNAIPISWTAGRAGADAYEGGWTATCDGDDRTGLEQAGSSPVRYRDGEFSLVWKTLPSWKDSCRTLHIQMDDEQVYTLDVWVK